MMNEDRGAAMEGDMERIGKLKDGREVIRVTTEEAREIFLARLRDGKLLRVPGVGSHKADFKRRVEDLMREVAA
jgi:hypothetical protein